MKTRLITLLVALLATWSLSATNPSGFGWGADLGGAIDMSGNDMSTINLDAYFGYKTPGLDIAGIGAGINMMVSNSNRSFPVYAIVRTSFRKRPSLCFLDLRGGMVFNNIGSSTTRSQLYLSPGIGVNLAGGATFRSYVIVSYVYNGMRPYEDADRYYDINGLHMACVRLGIKF